MRPRGRGRRQRESSGREDEEELWIRSGERGNGGKGDFARANSAKDIQAKVILVA